MTALVWLRCDLRTRDNPALSAALENGPAIAVYDIAPAQWRAHDDSPAKVDFWLRNLRDLSDTLHAMGVPLKILNGEDWADTADRMLTFCRGHAVEQVHVNAEWGLNERRRDEQVAQRLNDAGIDWQVHHGATLLSPGSVLTGKGEPYKVFTPYARACRERLRTAHIAPARRSGTRQPSPCERDSIPNGVAGYDPVSEDICAAWPAGEDAAADRLAAFCDDAIARYDEYRDRPAIAGTSGLSAYLAAGVLSPAQCLHAALHANQGELDSGGDGPRTWITEILWREFYIHLLAAHPHLSMHRPMQPNTVHVRWRDDEDALAAWQAGRTGIPIVDAAMRQLLALGWMHNRLRMVTAMFLSKNLLIDWRRGESWFMQNLIDGDLASNNGGWQWSASTGADAVPYFRVFNPVTQSQRFDPDGTFLRTWLPELAKLDNKRIHAPDSATRRACGYPEPIVDLGESRRRAIEAFAGLPRTR